MGLSILDIGILVAYIQLLLTEGFFNDNPSVINQILFEEVIGEITIYNISVIGYAFS